MLLRSIFSGVRICLVATVIALYIHYFIPQSWGFFTIEPRQALMDAYRIHDDGIVDKQRVFSSNVNYGMGISRKGIVLFTALFTLIDKKNLQWRILNEDSLAYLAKHGTYVRMNGDAQGIYKGKFLITKIDRPPDSVIVKGDKFPAVKQYILADVR